MLDLTGLRLRAAFFRAVRRFFEQEGFVEVDTPLRLPVCIPEKHIVPITADGFYLQASPELCMKQLLAIGADQIFQICSSFRKNERGQLHSEEFKILEWYRRGVDYFFLMRDCEALVRAVAEALTTERHTPFDGMVLSKEWQRLTVADAFAEYSPISLEESLVRDLFDELLVEYVEPHLGQKRPLFLYNYPVVLGSLARVSADSRWVERFELYMNGVEIANGFSELADPVEQKLRFVNEIKEIESLRGEKIPMPKKFLAELPKMGEAAGIALGLDRLFMLALNKNQLKDAQNFTIEEDFL